ncbi:MAG: hypothetical protein LHW45_08150 [Candidatus Cloacimonetes bacterium]|nr:hypothetical protein [Candidatus Cloacimonadota bacterium]MDY0367580.1 hypothetical protein [Candidatus Syntrophosphaera sp.]
MKRTILLILILVLAVGLSAQAMSLDSRRVPIQGPDNFTTLTVNCTADTVYTRVTVPAYAAEAWIILGTGAAHICADSLYSETSGLKRYAAIPAATAFTLPVKQMTKFYIRRAAAGTACVVNIIWRKL